MTASTLASPLVSVIVPHYNDLLRLDRCLEAISAQATDFTFEVIVADNNSHCGRSAVEQAIAGRARLTVATESGAGPARNAGVIASRGQFLAFTDSDCVPEPGWLSNGVAALSQHDFVGGAMTVLVSDARNMTGAEAFERIFAFDNRRYVEDQQFTVTANLFCSRQVFQRVGNFLSSVSEDIEWCHRATAMGFKIGYIENAVVGHPARANWDELLSKWRRLNAQLYALAMSKPGGRWVWAGSSLMLPASIVAHIPTILKSSAISGLDTRVKAIGTLARIRLWRLLDAWRLLLRGTS
jgi:glycosyltransferase involved in cell wall biosynthesis